MIDFYELTDAEFIYCLLLNELDDWNPEAFCERLLIEKYPEIQSRRFFTNNQRILAAQDLTIEQVSALQEKLSKSCSEGRWNFVRALCFLAA